MTIPMEIADATNVYLRELACEYFATTSDVFANITEGDMQDALRQHELGHLCALSAHDCAVKTVALSLAHKLSPNV